MTPYIEQYLTEARPILLTQRKQETDALWISDKTRGPMTEHYFSSLLSQVTLKNVGIAISPHLFRTAAATTLAEAKGDMPHLASALLNHVHPPITEEHYNRASSLNAGKEYGNIVQQHYNARKPEL